MHRKPIYAAVVAVALCLLSPAIAPAKAKPKKKPAHSTAQITVTAPASAATGASVPIKATSVYTVGANASQRLTLFLTPPGVACPGSARAPRGADVLLSGEPADRVLIVHAVSDPLRRSGTWTACGYLTSRGKVTARASSAISIG